ncbi:hypothetical protein C4553_00570 [Candidatus Parcubacteria bacterium]|nr:MAG: hypothetical protein C4553_00570 [Candidatus Parcubacteria bacterium]
MSSLLRFMTLTEFCWAKAELRRRLKVKRTTGNIKSFAFIGRLRQQKLTPLGSIIALLQKAASF